MLPTVEGGYWQDERWTKSGAGDQVLPASPSDRSQGDGQSVIRGVLQKDAFLVFRALCRLSIRSSDSAAATDLSAARGKVGFGGEKSKGHIIWFNQTR